MARIEKIVHETTTQTHPKRAKQIRTERVLWVRMSISSPLAWTMIMKIYNSQIMYQNMKKLDITYLQTNRQKQSHRKIP